MKIKLANNQIKALPCCNIYIEDDKIAQLLSRL